MSSSNVQEGASDPEFTPTRFINIDDNSHPPSIIYWDNKGSTRYLPYYGKAAISKQVMVEVKDPTLTLESLKEIIKVKARNEFELSTPRQTVEWSGWQKDSSYKVVDPSMTESEYHFHTAHTCIQRETQFRGCKPPDQI